jgi:predicted HTH transcriptional regulator
MSMVESYLAILGNCIRNNTFQYIETDRCELKDNSHDSSEWKEVHKTINAFLNTRGGIIIVGIHENTKDRKYTFKGFDSRNEEKVKEIHKQFTNEKGEKLSLELYISYEIKEFMSGNVLVIQIESLPEVEKYVYLNGKAYERVLTGDQQLTPKQIKAQEDYKTQVKASMELKPVPVATINDLDVDKLNEYIFLLNRTKKIETQKADIKDAKSFLLRKSMIYGEQPTVLGMLTCGRFPEDFLFNCCEIDCYVDHPSREVVAGSRKLFKDTVITLMQEGERFVMQNIDTGISIERSGSSIYEYPPELIRESINNSLAHRDYGIDRPVIIKVSPKKQIEIRNPGSFKEELLVEKVNNIIPVRRIIPKPRSNNPRLADILKVFEKSEGRGIGMYTLTGACLQNEIDLPYYIFHSPNELSLVIPSGKLIDRKMQSFFESYSGYLKRKLKGEEIGEEQKRVLSYLYKSELANKIFRHTILLTKDNNHLDAISSLIEAELIFPHPIVETDHPIYSNNPVYLLDRKLFVSDFKTELGQIFKKDFTDLKLDYKEILNVIYEANNFSEEQYLSANQIGNILWVRHGNDEVIEGFENYKRKVRNIISQLDHSKFIIRKFSKPQYAINDQFGINGDLFRNSN